VLRGRCGCQTVGYQVSDEFIVAYLCHCSNCRASTGSAFMPWGEIEQEKFRVTTGLESLAVIEENGVDRAMGCTVCWSLVYWTRTAQDNAYVRIPYGTLIDEPTLKPIAHMFVGSKAPWYQITDDLPQYDEYPWG
jgi:hypothetical protein